MIYATYEYYTESFGGRMPEDSFSAHARTASAYIRQITLGRSDYLIDKMGERCREQLSDACCAICDVLEAAETVKTDGRAVKSVSNDGYSVTYVTEADETSAEAALRGRMYDTAALYLAGTGLLNRRVVC